MLKCKKVSVLLKKFSPILLLFSFFLYGAQDGSQFPTHNYPTDRSFHLSYDFSWMESQNNYDSKGETQSLLNKGVLTRYRHTFTPEYQASRQLSFGFKFHIDTVNIKMGSQGEATLTGLSDQFAFIEYRVLDEIGYSLGFSGIVKFPVYSNPNDPNADTKPIAFLGDAQSDFGFLVNGEYWMHKRLRFQSDLGVLFRSEEHATEVPYNAYIAFMKPRFNLGLGFQGNFSMGNDEIFKVNNASAINTRQLRAKMGDSNYVLAENPSLHKFFLKGVYWASPYWAIQGQWMTSIKGKNAPQFSQFSAGISYRLAYRERKAIKRYKEVDIKTDQEKGRFDY